MTNQFRNRTDAGQQLAKRLSAYANRSDVLVLGLPRGGIPVAYEVAKALNAPLDLCLVRKLGVPDQPELAMGAIATGGVMVLNTEIVQSLNISKKAIRAVAVDEQQELQRREQAYRGSAELKHLGSYRPALDVVDRTLILVDDGIATGSTLRAAIAVLRQQHPAKIVVAVPVAPPSTCADLQQEVDEVVCCAMPQSLQSISLWYKDFTQTTDDEVRILLKRADHKQAVTSAN
ncbi:phosphoribosyltransferase [Oculatella sp. LEGE 06141]|uniref:phosphoribosyltransferase n=1 Tax=Oculatella sp. LEGE 06141 TaxID=1828648 RepID=UPI001882D15C|nr:phosphoribosyltransferase [Oculatella sp. LEGE 06141]MBE9181117.1 phosphoribosyltransferase [Oculatella sp. LEGE 06141]